MNIDGVEVSVTHPDKVLWKEAGITKIQYIEYLLCVSEYLLPHTRDRMLMYWLYPQGIGGEKTEKRSLLANAPDYIPRTVYLDKPRVLLNNKETLAWVANVGALELHVPFDRYDRKNYPTELVFDLDPSDPGDFDLVRDVALQLKGLLDSLDLISIAKTSGKTGLQIYVPIDPRYTFEEARKVNQFIAKYMLEKNPGRITLDRVVQRRGTKLYFDYLQLWKGRTMPAVYSVRATPQTTVSTPVTWGEIEQGFDPADFTLLTIPKRLKDNGDLFSPVTSVKESNRQSLEAILRFIETHV
jgi:bifunctional non-homologous end joining protein LigD